MSGNSSNGEALWQAAKWVFEFFTNSAVGSFASIAGLLVSLWVLKSVSEIRKRVMLKVRAPEAIKELKERASAISNALQDFPATLPVIEENIELANVTLKNVASKITGQVKEAVEHASAEIHNFGMLQIDGKTRDAVWVIYVQLLVSAKAIEHLVADVREEP